jgi:hypothetical protein
MTIKIYFGWFQEFWGLPFKLFSGNTQWYGPIGIDRESTRKRTIN